MTTPKQDFRNICKVIEKKVLTQLFTKSWGVQLRTIGHCDSQTSTHCFFALHRRLWDVPQTGVSFQIMSNQLNFTTGGLQSKCRDISFGDQEQWEAAELNAAADGLDADVSVIVQRIHPEKQDVLALSLWDIQCGLMREIIIILSCSSNSTKCEKVKV